MQKHGLGRGLSTLLGGAGTESESILEVATDKIVANPFQPRQRFDEERLAELAESVKTHGLLQPILLRRLADGQYQLVAGERRFRAAQAAGLARVPAIIKTYDDQQMLEVAIIENVQREDINPVEAAVAYQRLREEFGLTQEQISQRVGKARTTIANTMRLLSLPELIQESILVGEVSEAHGRAILQARPEAQVTLWRNVKQRRLTVHETERMARDLQPTEKSKTGKATRAVDAPKKDPHDAAMEESLSSAFGTRVIIRRHTGGGRVEIDFYSDEQLEGIALRIVGD